MIALTVAGPVPDRLTPLNLTDTTPPTPDCTGGWMAGARPARHSCCAALGRGCMIGPVGLVSERHEKACSTPMGEMAVVGAPDDFAGRILPLRGATGGDR